MRYADGAVIHQESDLSSSGFGIPWGHTRVYGNTLSQSTGGKNGNSWLVPQWQYLVSLNNGDRIGVVRGVTDTLWFDKVGSDWVGEFSIHATLEEDTNAQEFILSEPQGSVYRYHSFDTSTHLQGKLKSVTSAGDALAELSYDTIGRIIQFEQTAPGQSVVYDYSYSGGGSQGGGLGLLQDVTLSVNGTTTRRALYRYYGLSVSNGNYNDLERVTTQKWDGTTWEDLRNTYYRYWKPGQADGVAHGLKYLLKPEGYARMTGDGFPPESATDAKLAEYASNYFEYNLNRGVSKEVVEGGTREYTFIYTTSTLTDGNNNWKTRTVETRPDGSQVFVYSNYAMGVILRILKKGNDEWYRYVKYDENRYRAVLIASSEAVSAVNEPVSNGQALSVTLKENEGLITTKAWYTSDDNGGATDYLHYTAVKQGNGTTNPEIKQRELEYVSHTAGGRKVYEISQETTYLNDTAPLETSVTTYAYTWHSGTAQIDQKTTTLPIVATTENGDGQTAYTRKMAYDLEGNMLWSQDELGVITGYTYDAVTGARQQMIQDVNPATVSGVPSGWVSSSTSPLNLVSDYESDAQGRITQELGPLHEIDLNGTATNIRTATYTVYRDDLFEVRTAQGYQDGTDYFTINPVSIQKSDANGRNIESIQAERTGNGRLSPTDTFLQSSYLRWQTQKYNDAGDMKWQRIYHDIPQAQNDLGAEGPNYDQVNYDYDEMGRQNKQVSGGGTISRTVFDTRGLSIESWIGTDDSGATDSSPGAAAPNNMVEVSTQEYDNDTAGGNGNLTRVTQHVSGSETRVTQYEYDWRDRRTAIIGQESTYQSVTYNNQGQTLVTESRAGSASALLLTKSETFYDVLSRFYRSKTYAIDGNGDEGNALESNTYYDGAGQVIKQSSPGTQASQKTVFDSLRRPTANFTSYPADGVNDGNSNDVTEDIVVEQSETVYDAASNAISSLQYQRFHDAPTSGTGSKGSLNGPSGSDPKARIYRAYQWPDAIGRVQASANYGTSNIARPSLIPATTLTPAPILVSQTEYDAAGQVASTTDPQGLVNKQEYDDAGRVETEIENFVDGSNASDANNTKVYAYTSDGALKTLTWENASTGSQVTTWDYGTTLTDSGVASSQLLVQKIYPDGGDDHLDYTYNRLGELLTKTDQNGNVHTYDYNALGQLTHDKVTTLGTGVDGAVRRISTTYDSQQRVQTVTSWDDATPGNGAEVNQVEYDYNDFGQLIADKQEHDGAVDGNTQEVSYTYANGSNNTIRPETTTYPDGQVIASLYGATDSIDDVLSRVAGIDTNPATTNPLVTYAYLGLGTPVITDYTEPLVELTYVAQTGEAKLYGDPYNGLDWFGRIADQRWISGGVDRERVQYGYTENSLKQWRRNLVAPAAAQEDDLYTYDGLSQLIDRERGDLTPSNTISNVVEQEDWTYDPSGNWEEYDHTLGSTTVNQTRTNTQVNEIATYNGNATPRQYDKAGNMTRIPVGVATTSDYREATWDAWNRLRRIQRTTGGGGSGSGTSLNVWYDYDGLTRRTQKRIVSGANQGTVSYYYNTQWKCVEERTAGSSASEQYVYGVRGRNDLIWRDSTDSGGTNTVRHFALSDAMGSITAITNDDGVVEERYRYQAFGESQVLTPTFTDRTTSDYDWQVRFHGEQRDDETGYYNYGYRYYLSELGRWLSRDPIEEEGGYNLYTFVQNDGLNYWDYLGLDPTMTSAGFRAFNNVYLNKDKDDNCSEPEHVGNIRNLKFNISMKTLGGNTHDIEDPGQKVKSFAESAFKGKIKGKVMDELLDRAREAFQKAHSTANSLLKAVNVFEHSRDIPSKFSVTSYHMIANAECCRCISEAEGVYGWVKIKPPGEATDGNGTGYALGEKGEREAFIKMVFDVTLEVASQLADSCSKSDSDDEN